MKTEPVSLDNFTPEQTCQLEILSPTGAKTGWVITLAGASHPRTIANAEAGARMILQKRAAIERAQINGKTYDPEELSLEEERAKSMKLWQARILDWSPVSFAGQDFPYSDKSVETLVMEPKLAWAFAQVAAAIDDDTRFIKRSVKP